MRSETNRKKKHSSYTMFLVSHGRLLALTCLSMVDTHTLLSLTFTQNFFELALLRQNTATCLINNLKNVFARYGIPEEVISDNGSQYSNTRNLFDSTHDFKMFAKEWGFKHTTSSPEYPQSNGAAERAVQTAKRILNKASADGKDPFGGLLKYRNTPFEDIGLSPAQLLMSRRTCTMLPTHNCLLNPLSVNPKSVVKVLKSRPDKTQGYYGKTAKDLPLLEPGDRVRIRPRRDKQWRQAEVLPRSYVVREQQDKMFRRNRKQIIATPQDLPLQLYSKPPPPLSSMSSASPPTKAEPSVISEGLTTQPNITTTRSRRVIRKPERLIDTC